MSIAISNTPVEVRRPATLPHGLAKGKTTEKIIEVTRTDAVGNSHTMFECGRCQKSFDTFSSTMAHMSSHATRSKEPKESSKRSPAYRDLVKILKQHDSLQRKIETLRKKLADERARRVKAENRLRQIEDLFAGRGITGYRS